MNSCILALFLVSLLLVYVPLKEEARLFPKIIKKESRVENTYAQFGDSKQSLTYISCKLYLDPKSILQVILVINCFISDQL
jgi:hypothetical protein